MTERRLVGGSLDSLGRFTRPDLPVSLNPNTLPILRYPPLLRDT